MITRTQSNLEILKRRTENLLALLNDPHPGLHTWLIAYERALEAVAEFSANHVSNTREEAVPEGGS